MINIVKSLLFFGFLLGSQASTCGTNAHEEANKRVVLDFYDKLINQKDVTAASQHIGLRYTQHNPLVADGIEGLKAFIDGFVKPNIPNLHGEIKHVYTDGDFVILHVHSTKNPRERGAAIIDVFKLTDSKIVEHWDVNQTIPEKAANSNTMF